MYTVAVVAIITAITTVVLTYRLSSPADRRFFALLLGVGSLIAGALLGSFIAAILGISVPKYWQSVETVHLESVTNVQGIQASGGGNIFMVNYQQSSITYYNYWYTDGNGFRHGQMTDADNVKIIQDANADTATLVTYGWVCDPNVLPNLAICEANRDKEHDFHVPPGTIVQQFSLTPGGQPSSK